MSRTTLLLVADPIQAKALKNILAQRGEPYFDAFAEGRRPAAETMAAALEEAQEIRAVICLARPPFASEKPYPANDALTEENLTLMQAFAAEHGRAVREVLAAANGRPARLVALCAKAAGDPFRTLMNVFVHTYFEGLAMEAAPRGVAAAVVYHDADAPPVSVTEALFAAFAGEPGLMHTNLGETVPKEELPRYRKTRKNRQIAWQEGGQRAALVTGASSGIGHAVAKALIDHGWRVYSFSRSDGVRDGIIFWRCDLTDREAVAKKFSDLSLQEPRLSLVVNNSGIGTATSLELEDPAAFSRMYALNVNAACRLMREARSVLSKNMGAIVNIGSVAGFYTIPFQTGYSITKALLDAYTELLLDAYNESGVRLIDFMPGDTRTRFGYNREFNEDDKAGPYAARLKASIAAMARDEQRGHAPEKVAKAVLRQLERAVPPVRASVGAYRILVALARRLPQRLVGRYLAGKYASEQKS